nr:metallophosphoesterase family protein [uncultured Marinifilum sp.]
MKLGIFQDIHGNLQALKKGVETFRNNGCEKIVHVGDLIGIGPYPKECLDFAFSIKEMEFVMGNHDYWYAYGLPNPIPAWMSKEEVEHRSWINCAIGNAYRNRVKKWKFSLDLEIDKGRKITFQHYGLNKKQNWFAPRIESPSIEDLDVLFNGIDSEMIFYGHKHDENDKTGRCRYINLGSGGCYNKPEVRIGILELIDGKIELEKRSVQYNDNGLMDEFEIRKVPVRERITSSFIRRD